MKTKKYETVKASTLEPGDTVRGEDRDFRIGKISNGFYTGSKLLGYTNGEWSCVPNTEMVQRIARQV